MSEVDFSTINESIRRLKAKATSSNEAEFLCIKGECIDQMFIPCARVKPKDLKRYVQMKQDLIENIEGPFLYTKHPWASMIGTSVLNMETRTLEYPQLPDDKRLSSLADRIEDIERSCLSLDTSIEAESVTKRIYRLLCKLKEIKSIYSITDGITCALDSEFNQSILSTQNSSNFDQLVLVSAMEKFILDIKRNFPYIYSNEFSI